MLWGAATAAFQIEGAACTDGKGPSIWDVFCSTPGKTAEGVAGLIACDHYHRWREDLEILRDLGLSAYRFSVSWPRVLPQGRGAVNPIGLDFYDRLVDGLLQARIEPLVTLYHWDLPAALQMELHGWENPDIAEVFADYARVMFDRLGDRVKLWLTLNEPWVCVDAGYFHGVHAPGVKDPALGYRVAHNFIRAHAHAVAAHRAGKHSSGKISFALNSTFSYPASDGPLDREAAQRAMESFAGWFGDPMFLGDYPASMRRALAEVVPEFSQQEVEMLRGSCDFLALNYYFSDVVRHAAGQGPMQLERVEPSHLPRTEMDWPIMPHGLTDLLVWLSARYGRPPVYVTENGAAFADQIDPAGQIDDRDRIEYLRSHIAATEAAAALGVDLRGYFVWSLLDNLEWSAGFSKRFGLVHCDRRTLKRTIKASGRWYADFVRARMALSSQNSAERSVATLRSEGMGKEA